MTPDHHNKYSDEKVWNVRITICDPETRKWGNAVGKMVLKDFLHARCHKPSICKKKNTIKVSNKKRYAYIFNLHKRPYCFIHCREKTALEVKLPKLIKLTSTPAKIKRQIWGKNNPSNSKVTQSQSEATQLVRNVLKYKIHVI